MRGDGEAEAKRMNCESFLSSLSLSLSPFSGGVFVMGVINGVKVSPNRK